MTAAYTHILEARIAHLERALKTIATIEHCDECNAYGDPDEPFSEEKILQHRLDHPVTHETTFFGLRKLLCTECAERVAQAHRKAESKGSGKQPEVVPYSGERRITTALALDALKDQPTTPAQPTTAQAVAVVHNISMTRVRVLWDKLAEELGIIRAAEEEPK